MALWFRYLVSVLLACAAAAGAFGVYGAGGLASYGDLVSRTVVWGFPIEVGEPLGTSFWVGGGAAVPVWTFRGPITMSLELVTDAGFSTTTHKGETGGYFEDYEIHWETIAVREDATFGVGFGPGAMIKPYVGFGGGVAVVPWSLVALGTGVELDSHTEVKPALDIPFGCDFRLTPAFSLGVKADYTIVTGDATPFAGTQGVETQMPNAFLLLGVARADF